MFLKWLGTRSFIANTTAAGLAMGYFALIENIPLLILIAVMWIFSLITWAEYRNALANM